MSRGPVSKIRGYGAPKLQGPQNVSEVEEWCKIIEDLRKKAEERSLEREQELELARKEAEECRLERKQKLEFERIEARHGKQRMRLE
ncbi:hypothetical protein TNCV_559521 [Trichonephila clavipes]|nr:hypothetical protein TNCV_559521 [Trichonephila clavipes]